MIIVILDCFNNFLKILLCIVVIKIITYNNYVTMTKKMKTNIFMEYFFWGCIKLNHLIKYNSFAV